MDLGLQGKTVLISGSSQGIGLQIAKSFLAEEANVIITGQDLTKLNTVAASLKENYGVNRVLSVQCDLTTQGGIQTALDQSQKHFGAIDIVVANLGSGRSKIGWELEHDDWQKMLDVNFIGAMDLATKSVPYLTDQTDANIIFISSIAGCEALPAPISYSASKAALQHAAKNLSRELGPKGIRVNTIAPGNILAPGGTWERKLNEDRNSVEKYIKDEVPLGRIGSPEEISNAVVFLASPRASFVTGALWIIDGGQTRGC